VRRGEALLKLEAMKMELLVRAPRDGIVRAVNCRQGEVVAPGVPLVDISSDTA
jgi:biotin carboxyl carrier protein